MEEDAGKDAGIYDKMKRGFLKSGCIDDLKDNYNHRHQSPSIRYFRDFEKTKKKMTRVNYIAIARAVEKRLSLGFSDQTGWSYAHMANIFARLENGSRAYECLSNLIRSCVKSNLFTYHNDWRGQGVTTDWFVGNPPFQIDANFGFTAACSLKCSYSKPDLYVTGLRLHQIGKKDT